MPYQKCSKCKGDVNHSKDGMKTHFCKPFQIKVTDEFDEDDKKINMEVYASSPKKAAEKFAEIYNLKNAGRLLRRYINISVDGKAYCIGAEYEVIYYATKLKNK